METNKGFIDIEGLIELKEELNNFIIHCQHINNNIKQYIINLEAKGYKKDDILAILSEIYEI